MCIISQVRAVMSMTQLYSSFRCMTSMYIRKSDRSCQSETVILSVFSRLLSVVHDTFLKVLKLLNPAATTIAMFSESSSRTFSKKCVKASLEVGAVGICGAFAILGSETTILAWNYRRAFAFGRFNAYVWVA